MVLRMQDSQNQDPGQSQGRELTMFLNCHGGSYQIPEATSISVFEWKNHQLCHAYRVCGNTKYWKGHFGVGAAWSWGNSVSDFTRDSNFVNNIVKLADGSPGAAGGVGGAGGGSAINSGSLCINSATSNVRNIGIVNASSGNASARNHCYSANILNSYAWGDFCSRNRLGGIPSGYGYGWGHNNSGGGDLNCTNIVDDLNSHNSSGNICVAGASSEAYAELDNHSNLINVASTEACNKNVSNEINFDGSGGNGGNAGNGYSPVFGIDSGNSTSNGNIDTDFNSTVLQVDFALDFGQIERYCSAKQEEVCF